LVHLRSRVALVALVLVSACPKPGNETDATVDTDPTDDTDDTDDSDTTGDTDDTAVAGPLACAPLHSTLAVTGTAQTIQFSATLETDQGVIPATDVNWIIDGPGMIASDGLYTSPADFGGEARITAVRGTDTADCTVDIEAEVDVNSSGNGSVPGAFESSTPTIDDACAADLLYPLANSAMPGSFAPPLIQWTASGANMFALELSSEMTTITVYTSNLTYQPTVAAWYGLTHYDPGQAVHIRLTSGNWNGSSFSSGTCTSTNATDVEVTDGAIDGTIVYWAPPITKQITFSSGVPASNEVLDLPGAICQGCHAVNLSKPKRMTYGPNFPGRTNLVDLDNPTSVLQSWGNGMTDMKEYGAPDKNGEYVVVSAMSMMQGSSLTVYRQDTGASVYTLTTSRSPTMPNWSPDNTKLVYAGCDNGASALGGSNCDLYVQTWNPTTEEFGNEVRIATHPAGHTLYYPTFSPDSTLVAYNSAEQWSDGQTSYNSNANPKAKMMIVSASGGTQMELTAANGVGDLTNSWPRWAPAYGTYAWLAVSSKRAYGSQVTGTPQLWVTAIDLEAAATGTGDPSKPPTWIPGQLISEGNHTPTWLPNKDRPTE
jgi:hypothetical protein